MIISASYSWPESSYIDLFLRSIEHLSDETLCAEWGFDIDFMECRA